VSFGVCSYKAAEEHAQTLEELGRLRAQLAKSEKAQGQVQDSMTAMNAM
jgi:hypothetical protein